MGPQEATEAVDSILQTSTLYCVIPMHYTGTVLADYFAERVDCKVIILTSVPLVHFQLGLAARYADVKGF
ncbi:MAG: hypothetical protein ACFFB3_18835 [Candidatus Hodarchaeota archaeon]